MSRRRPGAARPSRQATGARGAARSEVREHAARARAASRSAHRRRRAGLVGVVAVLALSGVLLAQKAHGAPQAGRAAAETRPSAFGVGVVTCRFVDPTRATPNFLKGTSTPGRVLFTEIRYPTLSHARAEVANAAPARRFGPYGLVVFAHGYRVTPDTYKSLLDAWVRSGLVVAAPIFPDTSAAAVLADDNSSLNENDDVNQPGDVAFVTRQVLADSAAHSATCARLYRLVRPGALGLAGQSDGAETVAALAYDRAYKTTISYRAVAVLSGQEFAAGSASANPYARASGPALFVVQSRTDACNPPQLSTKLYDDVAAPGKWFLTLQHAEHLPPYSGRDPAAFAVVSALTTRFFDLALAGRAPGGALARLAAHATGVASLTSGARAPNLSPLVQSAAACYLGVG